MTALDSTARPRILVAIDIAKAKHDVLVELPTGKRRKMIVRNQLSDFRQLAAYLKRLEGTLEIALEPTADYHRNLAYFLKTQSFEVKLVSSIAVARTREALHNSWEDFGSTKQSLISFGAGPADLDNGPQEWRWAARVLVRLDQRHTALGDRVHSRLRSL